MKRGLPAAERKEVDIWTVRLVATHDCVDDLFLTLSNDEKIRARAFQFEKHRQSFIIARGLLRAILAWYIELPAERVSFQYGRQGKPELCTMFEQNLRFNIAHSEGCVIFAFARGCEVGVDVELVRELPDLELVAEQFFAPVERADLLSVPPEKRAEAFFNCWTRKEAYLKATGTGLSVPLSGFRVSLIPGRPATFVTLPDNFEISQWSLFHLVPMDRYIGAVAIPSRFYDLEERRFETTEDCLNFLNGESPITVTRIDF